MESEPGKTRKGDLGQTKKDLRASSTHDASVSGSIGPTRSGRKSSPVIPGLTHQFNRPK